MKKSIINLVNSLKAELMGFVKLVESLEKKDLYFIDKLLVWINRCEDILTTYNISEVSELSGLKSKILAPKFSDDRTVSIKKYQLKIAADNLYDLQNTVLKVLQPKEEKVEECRELMRQILLIISQTKAIQYNRNLPFDTLIGDIWAFILGNEQLKAGAVKLRTSLIMTDIQILIADEINLEDF